MSEKTKSLVNNELTKRFNNAYIGSVCRLLRGDDDNWVMMECEKDEKTVDVLFTLNDMEEMVNNLKKELNNE
jgi:hypothetical protein